MKRFLKAFCISLLTVAAFASHDIKPGSSPQNQRGDYPELSVTVHDGNIMIALLPKDGFPLAICYGTAAKFASYNGLPCHDAIPQPEIPAGLR